MTAITVEPAIPAGVRFADLTVRGDWAIAVRETHHADTEAINDLVRLDLTGASDPTEVRPAMTSCRTARYPPMALSWPG